MSATSAPTLLDNQSQQVRQRLPDKFFGFATGNLRRKTFLVFQGLSPIFAPNLGAYP